MFPAGSVDECREEMRKLLSTFRKEVFMHLLAEGGGNKLIWQFHGVFGRMGELEKVNGSRNEK